MNTIVPAMLGLLALAGPSAAIAAPLADLRDYALASCLTRQTVSRDLQTEGYRLAGVVLARAGVGPLTLKPLDAAVGAALARRGMVMVHVDGSVDQATQAAPLASCLRAIDSPSVRRAMRTLASGPKR